MIWASAIWNFLGSKLGIAAIAGVAFLGFWGVESLRISHLQNQLETAQAESAKAKADYKIVVDEINGPTGYKFQITKALAELDYESAQVLSWKAAADKREADYKAEAAKNIKATVQAQELSRQIVSLLPLATPAGTAQQAVDTLVRGLP